jgi:hypothetical protein
MLKGQSVKEAEEFMQHVFAQHRQRVYKNGLDMALSNRRKVGSFATRLGRIAVKKGVFASAAEWKAHFTDPHVRSYRYVCASCAKPVKLVRVPK